MDQEEIKQMGQKEVAEWMNRRQSLDCPMVGKPCIKRKCRFFMPAAIEQKDVPGGEPEHRVGYRCMFDLMHNDLTDVAAKGPRSTAPSLIIPGRDFPGLPPMRGPN